MSYNRQFVKKLVENFILKVLCQEKNTKFYATLNFLRARKKSLEESIFLDEDDSIELISRDKRQRANCAMKDLDLKTYYPLKQFTTLKIGGPAKYFFEIHLVEDVFQALSFAQGRELNVFILGGGSNVMVSDRGFDGIVLKMNTKGVNILEENEQKIKLKVAAGECWDEFVAQAVRNEWWGIENLSHIPGNVGAVAIQNVGAYGQEASDVIDAVEVCDIATGDVKIIPNKDCHFSYRTSIFNTEMKGQFVILHTVFTLKKHGKPHMNYPDVKEYFKGNPTPTLLQIREAIIHIRERKLPDPKHLGNAGSFFKNLILSEKDFKQVKERFNFSSGNETVSKFETLRRKFSTAAGIKLPTAFLLDVCGLKGTRVGGAALYDTHPLIIVNATGTATAHDVMSLMKTVRQSVFQHTGVEVFPEPTLLGFSEEELHWYFFIDRESL